jgi:hypothetical protein
VMEDKSLEMIEEVNHYSCLSFQRTFGKWLRIWIVVTAQRPMHFGGGKQETVGEKEMVRLPRNEKKRKKGKNKKGEVFFQFGRDSSVQKEGERQEGET